MEGWDMRPQTQDGEKTWIHPNKETTISQRLDGHGHGQSVQTNIHRNKVISIGVPDIHPLAGTWDPSKQAE